jgi:hypothetical protein
MRRAICPDRNLPGRASRAIKRHQATLIGSLRASSANSRAAGGGDNENDPR